MHDTPRPRILITVSGRDAPGITSGLSAILADQEAHLLDLGQSVIAPFLSLSILLETQRERKEDLLRALQSFCAAHELKLVFRILAESDESASLRIGRSGGRYALTLIAEEVTARALHQVAEILARHQLNIDEMRRLSEASFGCIEIQASATRALDSHALKRELLSQSRDLGISIALQPEGLYRRAKRMVVFDLDSTLIQSEGIDELAREVGRFEQVSAITHQAMQGGLDYDESLKRRVAELRGLTEAQIDRVHSRIQLTDGAEVLVRSLKRLGYRTALISGGFSCLAERFQKRLGIDRAFANELELSDGKATGNVKLPILNARRKAELLEELSRVEGIPLDQIIAVGDGANDLEMLERAGLGIAFNAKPIVRERADFALDHPDLSFILYLLGFSASELQKLSGTADASG